MKRSDALPCALILCKDSRLVRLLETELFYLGVSAHTAEVLSAPDWELCLLLADGDGFDPHDCAGLAEACGCPLVVFGRRDASLPTEMGVFLRRPFILTELENTLRRLLAGTAAGSPLWGVAPPRPIREPTEPAALPAALTAENGVVTVAGNTIPLTPAEWAIFEYLYTRRGEAVSREELSTLLGGGGNSVDVYVCKLRTKIEKPLGRRMIVTVRGVGYRMDI